MKIILFILLLVNSYFAVHSQQYFRISGKIIDNSNHQNIPLAHIYISNTNKGTISNTNGDYVINIPTSTPTNALVYSHIGYSNQKISFVPGKDTAINIFLEPMSIVLKEVEIYAPTVRSIFDSLIANLGVNYYSDPIITKTFLRINKSFSSIPQAYKTGNSIKEIAMDIFKYPYVEGNSNHNDKLKLVAWKKVDSIDHPNESALLNLNVSPLVNSDILKNISHKYIYDKKWMKSNSIELKGIEPYSEGEAFKIIYTEYNKKKQPIIRGIFLIDRNTYALVSYERFTIDKNKILSEKNLRFLNFPVNVNNEFYYFKYSYAKHMDKWSLRSIYSVSKTKNIYENKGVARQLFKAEGYKGLDKIEIEEFSETLLVNTNILTENIREFNSGELFRYGAFKLFEIHPNDDTIWQEYNFMDESDLY